jgi:hypothetical protein
VNENTAIAPRMLSREILEKSFRFRSLTRIKCVLLFHPILLKTKLDVLVLGIPLHVSLDSIFCTPSQALKNDSAQLKSVTFNCGNQILIFTSQRPIGDDRPLSESNDEQARGYEKPNFSISHPYHWENSRRNATEGPMQTIPLPLISCSMNQLQDELLLPHFFSRGHVL